MNIGSSIMGALLGRRSTRASTSMRSYSKASKEKDDIHRAKDNLDELQKKFEDLEREFNDELEKIGDKIAIDNLEFEDLTLSPRKSDITIERFCLCWLPWRIDRDGIAEPIY